jgi:hypothetical protein
MELPRDDQGVNGEWREESDEVSCHRPPRAMQGKLHRYYTENGDAENTT